LTKREEIVAEAISWLGTPWHHRENKKGIGVDCIRFLIEVYSNVGIIDWFDPGYYSPQWHFHSDAEILLNSLKDYTFRVNRALPGDIVVFKFAKVFNHVGIVINYPEIVHVINSNGVVRDYANDISYHGTKPKTTWIFRAKELK